MVVVALIGDGSSISRCGGSDHSNGWSGGGDSESRIGGCDGGYIVGSVVMVAVPVVVRLVLTAHTWCYWC